MPAPVDEVNERGFFVARGVLTPEECEALGAEIGRESAAGRRGLLALPAVAAFALSSKLIELVRPHVAGPPRPVRAILFDKSPRANWLVAWHQDLTIAVRERIDISGFGTWSVKQGIPHVQPPVELLAKMLTVRVHLDVVDAANGPLRVLPGTHQRGRLSAEQVAAFVDGPRPAHECEALILAAAGDALLMRPLLLHASSRATSPRHRRVLHVEYAGFDLPSGLDWHPAS